MDDLAPEQFGVCRPGGMEAIIHDVWYWVQSLTCLKDCCILQLDFRIAFKTLSRSHILLILRDSPDSLCHYANVFCNGPLTLYGHGLKRLFLFFCVFYAGVQQGDHCGPLLFALGIQLFLRQLSALNIEVRFYLDNGILYGKSKLLAQALYLIKAFGVKTSMFPSANYGTK